ncbi:MAG TPA: TolC family protein [Terriglobia bacterium]|nr:TolC family protein [Terriglobia bacterium]
MIRAVCALLGIGTVAVAVAAPQVSQGTLRLADLEAVALERNPTLAQAEANVSAARGKARQAGLYPNPTVGATADEVSNAPTVRGGKWGFFLQQQIVLGGKLSKSELVLFQDATRAEAEAQAQRLRVLTSVRQLFYRALAAGQTVAIRTQMIDLLQQAVVTSRQLQNVGQADQPDILEIEVEQERAGLALTEARNAETQVWKQLAAVTGNLDLQPVPLDGNIDQLPEIDSAVALEAILRDSPEIMLAQAGVSRAEAALRLARAEKIPDLDVRGGLIYNRELVEPSGIPTGLQGFFDVGIQIPLFNRNQGGVAAAEAELVSARREVDRINLSLRARFAAAYKDFIDSRDAVERYRTSMLPRAQRAYELYLASFRQMAAAYPQVLIARRTLFQLQDEYSERLAKAWSKAVEIQGLLLSGGLDMPGKADSVGRQ